MSWDNVKGVSAAQIWTDNPDMTQAYLFANGNHQVKLTVGLSLTLSDATQPGPTEDEVKAALTLVDYETGAGVRFIKTGAKGGYDYVYQPNMPATINVLSASDTSNPGAYQYELDYYVSSDSTINANYASEKVALFLSYINSSGAEVDYNTASGSKSQNYVAVTVYPPKKYGTSDSSSTPVIIKLKDDEPEYKISNHPSGTLEINDSNVSIYSLLIDDGNFRIISYLGSSSIYPFHTDSDLVQQDGDQWQYTATENYLIPDNKLNEGSTTYSSQLQFVYNKSQGNIFTIDVNVSQEPNEIIFIKVWSKFFIVNETFSDNDGTSSFSAYDQFGNIINIEVASTNDGFNIKNVT